MDKQNIKTCIYYRISTRDKQSIDMQKKSIHDYCDREHIQIVKEYEDIGQSGKKESRPGFDAMLNDMRQGLFNCIVVYKLDRIGRSLSHLVKLFEEFRNKDISFISVTQNINTSTPEGRMFLHMLMVLAEYERELIVNRINDGLAEARSKGTILGRKPGSKDKGRRIRSGYYLSWNKRKHKQSIPKINQEVPKEEPGNIPK